ncbi:MAG: TetR/AcrR family transcriptional regulator [Desulfuromonadaceae bacterium]|nr:TetR/AcrR family transcriptional regulator [Desulfuromonadaceae bacterium]
MDNGDIKNKLITTATRLFAECGLHGVSVRELSKAAGVSISMISYHFDGKERLYSSVLVEQFSCFDHIDVIKKSVCEPLDKLEDYIRWSIRRYREKPYLLKFYTSELTNPTHYFAQIVQPAIEHVILVLIEIIEEGIRKKQLRSELNPEDTALALVGMVNYYFLSTLATQGLVNHSPQRDEDLTKHYMDIFTKGISATSGNKPY